MKLQNVFLAILLALALVACGENGLPMPPGTNPTASPTVVQTGNQTPTSASATPTVAPTAAATAVPTAVAETPEPNLGEWDDPLFDRQNLSDAELMALVPELEREYGISLDGVLPNELRVSLWDSCTFAGMIGSTAMEQIDHPGLARLSTEPCTWGVSMSKVGTSTHSLTKGWVTTVHEPDEPIAKMYIGEGLPGSDPLQIDFWGGSTIRYFPGFWVEGQPGVWEADERTIREWACETWVRENWNGEDQTFTFNVGLGNFNCEFQGTVYTPENTVPEIGGVPDTCPTFADRQLERGSNGSCGMSWNGTVYEGVVPEGWLAQSDDPNNPEACYPQTIRAGSATFWYEPEECRERD